MSENIKCIDNSYGIIAIYREAGRQGRRLFLLIQHRAGHWAFPKGHAQEGESDLDAARREFEEETGITGYTVKEDVFFLEHYRMEKEGVAVDKTVKYYPAVVHSLSVTIQEEEVQDYCWMPYEEALERITFREGKALLVEVGAFYHNTDMLL